MKYFKLHPEVPGGLILNTIYDKSIVNQFVISDKAKMVFEKFNLMNYSIEKDYL
jgi:hypothetical protein